MPFIQISCPHLRNGKGPRSGPFCNSGVETCCPAGQRVTTCSSKICVSRTLCRSCWFLESVEEVAGNVAEAMEPLDGYYNWDIFVDADFDRAKEAVKRGPRAFGNRARRTDSHGAVEVIRSEKHPLGWGHPLAEQGNKLAERAGGAFSLENPWDSFAWGHPALLKILKKVNVRCVLLNQCAYGAESVKPPAIISTAGWILTVNRTCKDVPPHYHLEHGLTGKVFDPNVGQQVWRTSLAAEYPAGLCWSWAEALRAWLVSDEGIKIMTPRTLVKTGKFNYILVRLDHYMKDASKESPLLASEIKETKAEPRQRENSAAVGGLRDPRRAVARSQQLRQTGTEIRNVIDEFLSEELIARFENTNGTCPFSSEVIAAARSK